MTRTILIFVLFLANTLSLHAQAPVNASSNKSSRAARIAELLRRDTPAPRTTREDRTNSTRRPIARASSQARARNVTPRRSIRGGRAVVEASRLGTTPS